ncbi:MAG: isoaspartyl peptidase/L-asparaginase [Haloarculaceae archaeon]
MHLFAHGGAGSATDHPGPRQRALEAAATAGSDVQSPVSAVVAAVRTLESDPQFNAGVGGAVQSDGRVRTDAGLMTADPSGGDAVGAACAMPGVEHAVDVARLVATETPHVLLAGDRAVAFARAEGVAVDRDLRTERTRERWRSLDPPPADDLAAQLSWVHDRFGDGPARADATDHDTVGAVATDGEHLAAATSTGGRWCALAGRVGDVPQVGSGFFASAAGAASATGAGEAIARRNLARRTVELLEAGRSPDAAAASAIDDLEAATGEGAGVIAVDRSGERGSSSNTEAMQTAASTVA